MRQESITELEASSFDQDATVNASPVTAAKQKVVDDNLPRTKGRRWVLLWLIVVAISLVVALGLVFWLKSNNNDTETSTSSSTGSSSVGGHNTGEATVAAPTPQPTTTSSRPSSFSAPTTFVEPMSAPSLAEARYCCFYSTSNDPCDDCGSGDGSEWCDASADQCGTCGGTYCNNGGGFESEAPPTATPPTATPPTARPPTPEPTARPSVTPGNPTAAPVVRDIVDRNLFAEATAFYVNPTYARNLNSSIATSTDARVAANLAAMRDVPSAYWIDVKSKITGNSTSDLRGILLDAARQIPAPLCVFMVYDLPNRDCNAFASRGEICCAYNDDDDGTCDYLNSGDCSQGLREYKTEYVDPYVKVLEEFDGVVPIVLVIEPDSLPNFATNGDNPRCGNQGTQNAYTEGIKYAVSQIANHTDDVAIYLDAAHGGWLGWEDNVATFVESVVALGIEEHLRGFATNVANYQGIGEPCGDSVDCRNDDAARETEACCADPCDLLGQYNAGQNEHNYARLLVSAFKEAIPGFDPHVIIDTGRNGNPSARTDCATWCNPRDVIVGEVPTADTLDPDIVDAYYWLKTPGESDGCTEILPSEDDEFTAAGECPRYDQSCAAVDSIGTREGEPYAPEAGAWFDYQIKMLADY
ncbi:hypothetical protein CTAYLR_008195 [Chrysophaeum taylorii]|uniref:Glucanase n=1 Tax=Chrysophaeum taylorii TaxID=2483200 RepID=A0AAD7XGJ4_9STRA|nr:hypothetical protein CTAYLR_008195 [Chrysophaeum taylorii]